MKITRRERQKRLRVLETIYNDWPGHRQMLRELYLRIQDAYADQPAVLDKATDIETTATALTLRINQEYIAWHETISTGSYELAEHAITQVDSTVRDLRALALHAAILGLSLDI